MEMETVIVNGDQAEILPAPQTKAELLLEKIKTLAYSRYVTSGIKGKVDELDARWKSLKAVIQNGTEYKEVTSELKAAQAAEIELDIDIRSLALYLYQESGEKKAVQGVEVKLFKETEVFFDPVNVRAWALEKMPGFLVLDEEKFKKWAIANAEVAPELLPEEVHVRQITEPRAQIATKLPVEYLPEEMRPAG